MINTDIAALRAYIRFGKATERGGAQPTQFPECWRAFAKQEMREYLEAMMSADIART